MTGKLLSDVSDTDDMNADEVMMVFHSLSLTHSHACLLFHSLALTRLEHNALLHMVCHHCCRVDAIAGARYSLTSYGGCRLHRSHR